jgi:hypothetical protein
MVQGAQYPSCGDGTRQEHGHLEGEESEAYRARPAGGERKTIEGGFIAPSAKRSVGKRESQRIDR